MNYSSINIQGNIISSDILTKIRQDDLRYQKPEDFGLDRNTTVRDEIGIAWAAAQAHWNAFKLRRDRLKDSDSGTSETRHSWIIPLMRELGYDLDKGATEIINEKSYPISHRAQNRDNFPVHIVGVNQSLDKRAEHGYRLSPHGLVQEYLNNHEHLYAITTNGRFLRLLRDATRLARLTYLEFDLEQIMEEELYAEFALLFRMLHATRMPQEQDAGADSIIEFYHQEALASGTRIRERLSQSVERSLRVLANGFLRHPENRELIQKVESEDLQADAYFPQLLRVVYRLLFLLVIEERNLLYPSHLDEETKRKRNIYRQFYSLHRLTKLAQSRVYVDPRKTDLWQSLLSTFQIFEYQQYASKLGLQALGSGIFDPKMLADIRDCQLHNDDLLKVLGYLTTIENDQKQASIVNYADLDVEEFGSVYEGLLDLNPYFQHRDDGRIHFSFSAGTDRKETGSYYTNHDLVAQLIKTSLEPLIEERLKPHKDKGDRIRALLEIKVCDPACGSGHFLLAAARKLALRIAVEETGEENPGKEPQMEAMRLVIQHCIYGVDKNPSAVELCKVALWIEGHSTGKPLSFLDHRIRPGDSLVGVDDLARLEKGIPDGAFKPVTGDDKKAAQGQKKLNVNFKKSRQFDLFAQSTNLGKDTSRFAEGIRGIEALGGNTLKEIEEQAQRYEAVRTHRGWWKDYLACNLFTYAFYQSYSLDKEQHVYVTSEALAQYLKSAGSINARLEGSALALAKEENFFHWPLEFPEVFEKGGFDLMLGNPPWERIKLQEKEFFQSRSNEIANAPNAAARKRLIKELKENNPKLHESFLNALHSSEAASKFIRESNRYPLTGRGDINTYSIFSEVIKDILNEKGSAGYIVPTGIATDDTNKFFFADLVESGRLLSLFDFENKKAIFENVHRSYKFCLLSIGSPQKERHSTFGFFLHDVLDLQDKRRVFSLSKDDFLNINPNTKTTPIFRTKQDAELTAKIYSRVPVLVNEEKNQNPWGISFMRMFDMSNDSDLFQTKDELEEDGFRLKGNRFVNGKDIWLPLYEGKMCYFFNHRAADVIINSENLQRQAQAVYTAERQLLNPKFVIQPNYWVNETSVGALPTETKAIIGFKSVTSATNERTFIPSIIPTTGAGNSLPILSNNAQPIGVILLYCNLTTLVFDALAKQKVGGVNLNFFYVNQFAALTPKAFSINDVKKIVPLSFELIYTSWDIKAFADDLWKEADDDLKAALEKQWKENQAATGGHEWKIPEWADAYPEIEWEREKGCPLPPFKWDDDRRTQLKAELDAYFALLYGLERNELRYILDPQDVYGKDFPGETFRVLKNKETKKYGEYRTRRLVLEAYDRLRPTWDMEVHLEKLKEIWEECQVDLSKAEKQQPKKKAKKSAVTETEDKPNLFSTEIEIDMKPYTVYDAIYTRQDASRITGLSPDKVKRWFKELSDASYEGLKGSSESIMINFHGIVELMVIGTLREAGVSLNTILVARKDLANRTGKQYPFATNDVNEILRKSGRSLFQQLSEEEIIRLNETGQYAFDFIIDLFDYIHFDINGLAKRFFPPAGNKDVMVDPEYAGGRAVVSGHPGIRAEIIFKAYRGPESIATIQKQYPVSRKEVESIVGYFS